MYEIYSNQFGVHIVRVSDGAEIPEDPNNSDYKEYLIWVAAGNVAQPYTPPS